LEAKKGSRRESEIQIQIQKERRSTEHRAQRRAVGAEPDLRRRRSPLLRLPLYTGGGGGGGGGGWWQCHSRRTAEAVELTQIRDQTEAGPGDRHGDRSTWSRGQSTSLGANLG
jgi:hypothetical protein